MLFQYEISFSVQILYDFIPVSTAVNIANASLTSSMAKCRLADDLIRSWLFPYLSSSLRMRKAIQQSKGITYTSSKRLLGSSSRSLAAVQMNSDSPTEELGLMRTARVVPTSPSYFTGAPNFTDNFLAVEAAYRKYHLLPVVTPGPRIAWKSLVEYRTAVGEQVKEAKYTELLRAIKWLSRIQPALMPEEVIHLLDKFKKDFQPDSGLQKPRVLDELGRARGVGRRKASTAVAWLVDGEGEVLINGRSLSQYFGRMHHRESAIFGLKATGRVDKYNVWVLAKGGGLTGQAEATTLAVSKALLVHEPLLKPALRRGMF